MSQIAIKGATTGTGVFTLESPATNTDRTLILPDEAGTVLTSASGLTAGNLTGSVPASAMPAGSVIQVVSTSGTAVVSAVGSATILTLSITPSSTSNKILVLASAALDAIYSSNAYSDLRIHRNTNNIMFQYSGVQQNSGNYSAAYGLSLLDSPSSTSSVTYELIGARSSGGTTSWSTSGSGYSLILMEIAA